MLNLINISFILAYVGLIPSVLMFFMFVRNGLTLPIICVFDQVTLLLGFPGAYKEFFSALILILWVFVVGLACINGLLNVNFFVTMAITYTNSTRLWMNKLWWGRGVQFLFVSNFVLTLVGYSNQLENERDLRSMRKHQLTYTAHQVFNKFTNDVFAHLVEFAL